MSSRTRFEYWFKYTLVVESPDNTFMWLFNRFISIFGRADENNTSLQITNSVANTLGA